MAEHSVNPEHRPRLYARLSGLGSLVSAESGLQSLQRRVKARIEGRNGASNELRTLEAAGVPRDKLISWLTFTVSDVESGKSDLVEYLRDRKDKLRSLAHALEMLHPEVDEALRDPSMRREIWRQLLGYEQLLGTPTPQHWTWKDSDPGAFTVPSGMKWAARVFRREAELFAQMLRLYGRVDSQAPVAFLLLQVFLLRIQKEIPDPAQPPAKRLFRGRFRLDYLNQIACLLTLASEATGQNKLYSADGLAMVWKRRGLPMLACWYKNVSRAAENPQPRPAGQYLSILAPVPVKPDTSAQ